MNLSTRIAVGVAVVLAATLLVVGAAMTRATRATLTAQIDDRLVVSVARAEGLPGRWHERLDREERGDGPARAGDERDDDPGDEEDSRKTDTFVIPDISGRNVALFVFGPNGQLLVNRPAGYGDELEPPPLLPPIPGPMAATLEGRIVTLPALDNSQQYRVLIRQGPGGATFVTASSLRPVEQAVNSLVRALLLVGALALAAAALASWWVIRRGLRPVDRAQTAPDHPPACQRRRVPDADPETELGRLGTALNEMLGQIEAGIRAREAGEARLRRFVADAAHELRTPLTSLRGYAELYRQGA